MPDESWGEEYYEKGKQVGYLQALSDVLEYTLQVVEKTKYQSETLDICDYIVNLAKQQGLIPYCAVRVGLSKIKGRDNNGRI